MRLWNLDWVLLVPALTLGLAALVTVTEHFTDTLTPG